MQAQPVSTSQHPASQPATQPIPTSQHPASQPATQNSLPDHGNDSWWQKIIQKPFMLLGGVLFILVFYFIFSQPRLISTSGSAKQQFPVGEAKISLAYFATGANRSALLSSGKVGYDHIVAQINSQAVDSIAEGPTQISPLGGGQGYQFQKTAVVKVKGGEVVKQLLAMLAKENVTILEARYLPINNESTQQKLLAASLRDAKKKAKHIAANSHWILGRMVAVSEAASNAEGGSTMGTFSTNDSSVELQKVVSATYCLTWIPNFLSFF